MKVIEERLQPLSQPRAQSPLAGITAMQSLPVRGQTAGKQMAFALIPKLQGEGARPRRG